MKNKGFTLIELLGILVVLGIISVISFVSITNIMKSKQEKEYQNFLDNIYLATESYLIDNPIETEGVYQVTIKSLIDSRLIKEKIKNPKTDVYIKESDYVEVTCIKDSDGNIEYNYEYKSN